MKSSGCLICVVSSVLIFKIQTVGNIIIVLYYLACCGIMHCEEQQYFHLAALVSAHFSTNWWNHCCIFHFSLKMDWVIKQAFGINHICPTSQTSMRCCLGWCH
jgi:hypothetical protein